MTLIVWLLVAVAAVVAATLVAARLGMFSGHQPSTLGLREGKLNPPSKSPNSVRSQAGLWPDHPQRERASIAPLALSGDGPATIARLAQVVQGMAGARIVEHRPDYLYVQFTTRVLGFVDDTEFWFDPAAGVIQVRSASRLGRKDLGVNRARVEAIRAQLGATT